MKIRELEPSDIPALKEIHRASGFEYDFPELYDADGNLNGQFARVLVMVDDDGTIVLAAPAKKLVELYLLMNQQWGTPRQRLHALMMAHEDMRLWLLNHGLTEAQCWVPPQVEKSFGKRLVRILGWVPSTWKSFCWNLKGLKP